MDGATVDGVGVPVVFAATQRLRPLAAGSGTTGFTPLARAAGSGAPLMARMERGRGGVLALATDPVGAGREGWELFPTAGRLVGAWSGAAPGPRRTGAEVYLDPGGLHGELKGDPEGLARRLAGVRTVHLAGWNFAFVDPAADYDYASLIDALHRRGVLVYAWLDPPFVNQRLWDDHPECRERTATGREALVDWRRLIALEDPGCFALATAAWDRLLIRFDWDGVNVAELYFEPDVNRADHTPFHPSALARFGRDPAADPAAFAAFRTDLVVDLNRAVLAHLNGLPRASDLGFQLTVIDDLLDPALAAKVGSDNRRLATVASEGGASLQVEDPYSVLGTSPLRYEGLAQRAATLGPPNTASIDLTVVDRQAGRPTPAMTGAELDLAVSAAASRSGRVALYSAGTVGPDDLAVVPGASASAVTTFDTGLKAPWSVTALAPGGADRTRLVVDGRPWPAGPGAAVVPAGEHRLEWSTGPPAGPALLRLTAELGTASVGADTLDFSYDSRPPALAVIDRRPTGLRLDGADAALTALAGPDGTTVVRLPGGTHSVTLRFT